MYAPQHVISSNMKTKASINLPIEGHCRPTKVCMSKCYAKQGHCARPCSTRKQRWVSQYLEGNDLSWLIKECRKLKAVRLSGTGDLKDSHVPNILKLADTCPDTHFWGMTRKTEIAKALNDKRPNIHLLLSVDSSSPDSVWDYQGKMCWGPRLETDTVPGDKRIITVFPYHSHGKVVKNMPRHELDCKAVWHEIEGCMDCGRCWSW